MFLFFLAEKLHRFVEDIRENMSSSEFEEWIGYYHIQWEEKQEDEQKEKDRQMFTRLKAKNKAALSKMGYR